MAASLQQLFAHQQLWTARSQPRPGVRACATGAEALDRQLNGGGLPRGALTECLIEASGIGECRWLLPLMARITQQQPLYWVNPPFIPNTPVLQAAGLSLERLYALHPNTETDRIWAMEQILREPDTGLLIAWPGRLPTRQVRRLQLAAEQGDSIGLLMQPRAQASSHSLAALRLGLAADGRHLGVTLCRQRGGPAHVRVRVELPALH